MINNLVHLNLNNSYSLHNNSMNLYNPLTILNPSNTILNPSNTFIKPIGVINPLNNVFISSYSNTPIISSVTSSAFLDTYLSNSLSPITINSSSFIDVNTDVILQKDVTKHFYEKLYNKWLKSDFENLLNYLVVSNNNVKLVKNEDSFKKNSTKGKEYDIKISYINNNIMSKYGLKSFLKKIVKKTHYNWYDLRKKNKFVKKMIYKKIEKKMKKMIIE